MGAIAGDVVAAYEVAGGRFVLVAGGEAVTRLEDQVDMRARRAMAAHSVVPVTDSVVALRRQRSGGTATMRLEQDVLAQRRLISGGESAARVLSNANANLRSSAAAISTIVVTGDALVQYHRFALTPLLRSVSVPADMGARRAVDVAPDPRTIIVPPDRAEIRIVAHRREQ